MNSYLRTLCLATAAAVTLGTALTAAGAASAGSPVAQSTHLTPAGTSVPAISPGAQLWARRYNGTGNNADVATAVAASPNGKTVYVTGQSLGTVPLADYATVAYNAATGARRWVARYNGAAGSLGNAPSSLAVSPNGKKVFVTGRSLIGQFNDYATVAYDAATGRRLWAKGYNGPLNNDDEATAIAVSPSSTTVYVTGFSWGTVGAEDYATIAYNATTGARRWVKRYNGPVNGHDDANAIAVNPSTGTLYVTGQSDGGIAGLDYATVAYGAHGGQLWVRRYVGPGNNTDDATSVAVNRSTGAVYVTGQSWGGASGFDYATVAYAASGTRKWVRRYNGPGNNADQATSVAVSPAHKTVYVTGQSAGTTSGTDYATVAYTGTGARRWVRRYNDAGNGTDTAAALAVNPATGTVYVTGRSSAPSGVVDYATVAYTAAGTRRWVKRPIGSVLFPSAIAVSATTGTVFVTGGNTGDYTTVAFHG
jgi:WD40 repeat protein